MLAPGAIASEHVDERNDTEENSTENSVEIGVGQSLSVAVDNVSAQVEKQVSDVARTRSLGEASSESERSKILSEDLNSTLEQAREVNKDYQSLVDEYKDGNISRSELVTELAKLSNRADRIEDNLDSIRYASQFIPKEELNSTGVNEQSIENARKNIGVVGSDVAKVAKQAALDPNAKVSVVANKTGLTLAVERSDGRSYNGVEKEKPEHGQFNISADDALKLAADKYGFNESDYETSVEKDDDGYYEVEAENETIEYEVIVDGQDGSFLGFEKSVNRRGPPEDTPSEEDDERGPPEDVPRGPPEWADNGDDRRGPPTDVPRDSSDEDEDDDDTEELTIETEGAVQQNSTTSFTVTYENGTAVSQADVLVNGESNGQTNETGVIEITIPDSEDVEIEVNKGDFEGEVEYEFEDTEDESEQESDGEKDELEPREEDGESEEENTDRRNPRGQSNGRAIGR